MSQSLEQDLDVVSGRMAELEKIMTQIQENQMILSHQVKEAQMFIIKLAKNQSEITKRVSQWPYIAVPARGEDEPF